MIGLKKILKEVRFPPNWTTFIGALESVLRAKGEDYSKEYLMGISGFAFRINVHKQTCPSGPTVFNWHIGLTRGIDRLGYDYEYIQAFSSENLFGLRQKRAIINSKRSIDNGVPVVAWDLHIPEFGIIKGYDDEEKMFWVSTCLDEHEGEKGPLPFKRLGLGDVPILSVLLLKEKIPVNLEKGELESIRFAVNHAKLHLGEDKDYSCGLDAYTRWISVLENNVTDAFGNAYNAAVYCRAREDAFKYLSDMAKKYEDENLENASKHYKKVYENLQAYVDIFPFPKDGNLEDKDTRDKGMQYLREALRYEKLGIEELEKFLEANEDKLSKFSMV